MAPSDQFLNQGSENQNCNTGSGPQFNNSGGGTQYINLPAQSTSSNFQAQNPPGGKEAVLKSLNFSNDRYYEIQSPYPDTCDWLFETSEFQKWTTGDQLTEHKGVLWITGTPGVGKSTLMKHALQYCRRKWKDHLILSYFFNARRDTLERSSFGMMRSLVGELIESSTAWYDIFVDFFRKKNWTPEPGKAQWRLCELENFLKFAVQMPMREPLLILIDAIDECEEQSVFLLVKFLESLSTHAARHGFALKICISGRHYPYIDKAKSLQLIVEEQKEHEKDIARYIDQELVTSDVFIRTEVQRKAKCTFIWVVLVVQILNQKHWTGQRKEMPQALNALPDDLATLFDEVLGIHSAEKGQSDPKMILLIQWVLLSRRPLRSAELYSAIDGEAPPDGETAKLHINHVSKGLVKLEGELDANVQFIHLSVNDYLYRNKGLQALDPNLGDNAAKASHGCLWSCCWVHMQQHIEATGKKGNLHTLDELDEKDPFLRYAVKYILDHADEAIFTSSPDAQTQSDYMQRQIEEWLRQVTIWFEWRNRYIGEPGIGLLNTLASSKHFNLLPFVLDRVEDVNAQGGRYGNALQAAVNFGHDMSVQQLLRVGADVNAQGGEWGNALAAAVYYGYDSITKLLLVSGADANARGGEYGNALRSAVYFGREGIINLLLDYGAKIDAQDDEYGTALQAAVCYNDEEITTLLLDRKAGINVQGGMYGTALQAAVANQNLELTKILLKRGADVNLQCGVYGNALQAAVRHEDVEIAELLLRSGAEIGALGSYKHALSVTPNRYEMRRLLLDYGADPEG